MSQHAHALFLALREAALGGPGDLDPALRRGAFEGALTDPVLARFAGRVRTEAAAITDEDFAPLQAAGLSEDAIFELAVAVAVGAAEERLAAARAALQGGEP